MSQTIYQMVSNGITISWNLESIAQAINQMMSEGKTNRNYYEKASVIGINDYPTAPLKGCIKDVCSISNNT